ncbi:hypothetical protein D082_02850 [Synechocystis sp. PCC 6714]|nr:hypothetical protein D082_02850 [Synechocystis sp. PCC 6714]
MDDEAGQKTGNANQDGQMHRKVSFSLPIVVLRSALKNSWGHLDNLHCPLGID